MNTPIQKWFFQLMDFFYFLFSRRKLSDLASQICFTFHLVSAVSPLLYSYIIVFLTACISLFNPYTNTSIFLIFRLLAFYIHSSTFSMFFDFNICLNSFTRFIMLSKTGHIWTINSQLICFLHLLNEKCTTLSHKSCIMNLAKKDCTGGKKGDRDGTIQLYKIFVF